MIWIPDCFAIQIPIVVGILIPYSEAIQIANEIVC